MLARLKLNSVKRKIALAIIAVILLCALIFAIIVNLVIGFQMSAKYRVEQEAVVESLTYSLRPLLAAGDYTQIDRVIESSLLYENIASVTVYDSEGFVIQSAAEDDPGGIGLDRETYNIVVDGADVGSFEVGFSREAIDDFVLQTTIVLMVALVVFLVLAALALYYFMDFSIIRPIGVFTRTIGGIDPENMSARLDIATGDEIGLLAASFNRMADGLEESHRGLTQARDELEEKVEQRTRTERRRAEQLRAINEISRRISAILSLDELLPYVAASLRETFDYYSVNIFLFAGDGEYVELKAGDGGYAGEVPVGLAVRPGEGVVGRVAATGELMNVADTRQTPEYPAGRGLPDTRSGLAVPIRMGPEILGVLEVASREAGAFDEIDVFTVQTLGDQLAVAVENARLYRETRDMAVLEERNRMAREIHDSLAQGFTGIVLQLEAAEQAIQQDGDRVQYHLNKARELARDSLSDARRSVWALRPQALETLPLAEAIARQLQQFGRDGGIEVTFDISGDGRALPGEAENTLLRIFQESLTNIGKHAGAGRVDVVLSFEEGLVRLDVTDNGAGFEPARPSSGGFGLISMRERARLAGGDLDINSEPGKGTRISVTIPTGEAAT